jgi:hypothetical protein
MTNDKIWLARYLQCPECEDGVHVPFQNWKYKDDDLFWNPPEMIMNPIKCKCGLVFTNEIIKQRSKKVYTVPSIIWVCPNCSIYQERLMEMTKIEEYNEEGEEWKNKPQLITTFEGDEFLTCRNCKNNYKQVVIVIENTILRELVNATIQPTNG